MIERVAERAKVRKVGRKLRERASWTRGWCTCRFALTWPLRVAAFACALVHAVNFGVSGEATECAVRQLRYEVVPLVYAPTMRCSRGWRRWRGERLYMTGAVGKRRRYLYRVREEGCLGRPTSRLKTAKQH